MAETTLSKCSYLGGCSYPIAAGDLATLCFGSAALQVRLVDGSSFFVPYLEVAHIEVSGPGTLTTGGGFVGGGFGVEGALEGMAIATVLNALTTNSKIHTFISLITNIGELHFHYGAMEPNALRIALSSVHTTLRRIDPRWRQQRIESLHAAQAQGLISELEVAQLTQRLSEPTVEVEIPAPVSQRDSLPPPIVGPKGRCPNCQSTVALNATECFSCKAMFGVGSAWKVVPFN